MRIRAQRDTLSWKQNFIRVVECASPSTGFFYEIYSRNERRSLYALKGSLTVEAALLMPFVLMILLAFFSFFIQYAFAAELQIKAAAEAKKIGIVMSDCEDEQSEITVYRSGKAEYVWIMPFWHEKKITERAVCRAWIGFTELSCKEANVYITPNGEVYHLYRDCTHLDLSIRQVTYEKAMTSKNIYGQKYRACELCAEDKAGIVYVTSEGDCYHSMRSCGGLKRTIRQVPISDVLGRNCCVRCISRGES